MCERCRVDRGCPPAGPPPPEPVPDTKIVKVKVEGAKATFRFSTTVTNSKFRCKLDKRPWKSAVGPTAVPDPTPVKRTFRVKL